MRAILMSMLIAATVVGCAKKEDPSVTPAPKVFSQGEYQFDVDEIELAEKALEATGHRFLIRPGRSTDWDFAFGEMTMNNHKITRMDRVNALEVFVEKADRFLEKYNGAIQVLGENSPAPDQRVSQLRTKVELSRITAGALRSTPDTKYEMLR